MLGKKDGLDTQTACIIFGPWEIRRNILFEYKGLLLGEGFYWHFSLFFWFDEDVNWKSDDKYHACNNYRPLAPSLRRATACHGRHVGCQIACKNYGKCVNNVSPKMYMYSVYTGHLLHQMTQQGFLWWWSRVICFYKIDVKFASVIKNINFVFFYPHTHVC